ncbi:SpoIIE family protein phosphatase [Streptomyces sp. WMMC940]|uniref:SpoIIE family protein phosphatase n=1 Tax=Streptomyces sp. WMMC940 TaxID=3015153 RepID=UPI0022B69680|nr:SpoIIE family protein phosphatase [Streptomyces sp. WMMC940]MCZ7456509.1 SpoIIE family protein phosphatase [Streptomyces sp. WMMC940]
MGTGGVTRRRDGREQAAARGWAKVVVNERGVVTGWSSAAHQLLGWPADRVLGRPAVELLAGADEAASHGAGPEPGTPPPSATGTAVPDGSGPGPRSAPGTAFAAPSATGSGSDVGGVLLRHRDGGLLSCRLGIRPGAAGGPGIGWEVLLGPASAGPAPTTGTPGGTGTDTELDRALLEALFSRSPVGLFVVDPELRLIRINPAAEGMQGLAVEEALGKRPGEAWPDFSPELAERVMGQVLRTGRPVIGWEKHGRPPGDPDHEHVYSASSFRLEDADGRVLGVADAAIDVTERHRAQERLALLAEGGARIGTSLEVMRTAQELAEVAVPRFADSMAVEVLEEVLAGEEIFPGAVRPGAVLRRAASLADSPAEPAGVYADGEVSTFPPASPSLDALTDLQPRLVDTVGADSAWVLQDPARGARILQDGIHSLMVVPLVAQDRVLGIATFYRWGAQGPFRDDDLTLATELAGRTAVCLDNTRRYLRERNTLMALQRSLLPGELPHHHGVEVAHEYVHAGTGGDWVDVVPLSGARVALVAGRVPGRGVATAAAMGRLRAAVHTLSDLDLEPEELLARMDDLVRRLDGGDGPEVVLGGRRSDGNEGPSAPAAQGAGAPATGDEAGCTCLYLIYDPISQRCAVASAGHPAPAVAHPDGTVTYLDVPAGAPLGRPGPPFRRTEVELPENAMLVLWTPGLLQSRAGDAPAARDREGTPVAGVGEAAGARLLGALARAPGSVRETCRMLLEALVPDRPPQDAALLVARTHALGPGRVACWDLPSDPAVVSTARSLVTRQLSSWALDEAAFATELIASELVTNAIRYARAPVRLRLIRDHVLTCEVSDGSSTSPRLRHARTTDEGGRGLLLVARCSERWGTRYTEDGKTIWAEQNVA